MEDNYFKVNRKSHMLLGNIYFWTATINKWQHLLQDHVYKQVIIDSLEHLSQKDKIDIFAFVIMPNHVHFIWRVNEQNGKETTVGSFLKFTAHAFKKLLKSKDSNAMKYYAVEANNKLFEFWQRDSLAVELYSSHVAYQKLDYLHNNPCTAHWQLANEPSDYKYSTAKFYEKGIKEYGFIKDLRDEFR